MEDQCNKRAPWVRQWELGRLISTGSSLWLICLPSGLSRRCFFSDLSLPSYPPCLFPLSSPGVPSPLSVRPVWRQYVKPSWQPTAPLSASNPQLPAPLVPSPACWSSLPVGWASAAVTPSSERLDGTLDPPAYISWFSMSVPNNPLFNFRGEALYFF